MSSPSFPGAAALALIAGLSAVQPATAQEMPRRKPGLWEMQMNMPQMPAGGGMKSQQCVDDKSDSEMMKRNFSGDGGAARCEQKSFRKTATGFEAESTCKTPNGLAHTRLVGTGDLNSKYSVQMNTRFEPPRRGLTETSMTMQAAWLGACPADLKPGQTRTVGGPGAAPGQPGGVDVNKLRSMSPEERRKAVEQMMQGMPKTR